MNNKKLFTKSMTKDKNRVLSPDFVKDDNRKPGKYNKQENVTMTERLNVRMLQGAV